MGKSKIEWTDKTWNPIRARNLETGKVGHFCEHVSEGCRNCYAEVMQKRFGNPIRYARQDRDKVEIILDLSTLIEPLKWRKPSMIFPCSMTDLFGDWVDDATLDLIFAMMALCPQHHFQILTKRPERMAAYVDSRSLERIAAAIPSPSGWPMSKHEIQARLVGPLPASRLYQAQPPAWPLPNVSFGFSVEDQATLAARLRAAAMAGIDRYVISYEPALGPIDPTAVCWTDEDGAEVRVNLLTAESWIDNSLSASAYCNECDGVPRAAQIIAGGESEKADQVARPANPAWFRSVRDQCLQAGVPFFFKQWGEWAPMDQVGAVRFEKAGKNRGRLYDAKGRLFPGKTFEGRLGDDGVFYVKLGKARAGRVLDGAIWDLPPKGLSLLADSGSGIEDPRESGPSGEGRLL